MKSGTELSRLWTLIDVKKCGLVGYRVATVRRAPACCARRGAQRLQMTVGDPGVTIGAAPRTTGAPLAGIHAQAAQAPIHGHAPVAGATSIG